MLSSLIDTWAMTRKAFEKLDPDVTTISDLYERDLEGDESFLLPYPTSDEDRDYFANTEKFLIQDGSRPDVRVGNSTRLVLEPMRHAAFIGNRLNAIVTRQPPTPLVSCLQEHLGFDPVRLHVLSARDYCRVINGARRRIFTLFPNEHIDPDRYVINPTVQYRLLGKEWLMEAGLPTPETHLIDLNNPGDLLNAIELLVKKPYVVKTMHGLSGDGQKMNRQLDDLPAGIQFMKEYRNYQGITRFLWQDLVKHTTNDGIQFYVDKNGGVRIMGMTSQVVDKQGHYMGGKVNYREQIPEMYYPIIRKAAKEAHKSGYFGIVGLDIIIDERDGEPKVIDNNLRLTGATPAYMLRKQLTAEGMNSALFSTEFVSENGLDDTLTALRGVMSKAILTVLSAIQVKKKGRSMTKVYGVIGAHEEDELPNSRRKIARAGLVIPKNWSN